MPLPYLGAAFDSRLELYPYVWLVTVYSLGWTLMQLLMNNESRCSIFDISDLRQPRYCFMFYPSRKHNAIWKEMGEQEINYGWTSEERKAEAEEEKRERKKWRRCARLFVAGHSTPRPTLHGRGLRNTSSSLIWI